MLFSSEEFDAYVASSFPKITDAFLSRTRVVDFCPQCNTSIALEIVKYVYAAVESGAGFKISQARPHMFILKCPECDSERAWLVYKAGEETYRLLSIPGDSDVEIPELPADPPSLRKAYSEAVRCMNANCPMAAAAMFRRALQVITRDILGAIPGTLATELRILKGKPNKLGIPLSQDFHGNSFIIKETGNQAAHPDTDPDLLDFTGEDAIALQGIFIEIVAELFIVPEASRKAKEAILKRRKIP
jgi:hypothetical protein